MNTASVADIFEKHLGKVPQDVRNVKKTVADDGFSFEMTVSETLSLPQTERLLEQTKEDILRQDRSFFADGLLVKNISGVHSDDDLGDDTILRIEILRFKDGQAVEGYRQEVAEAEARDHRKLGAQLGLWTFSELVGPGLPLFTPKGTTIRKALHGELLKISKKYGAQEVSIPHIAKKALYDVSGHSEKFSEELIRVVSKYDEFVLKPVNCPHHTQIYASEPRSYRDLPLRYIESTTQYRDEKPGEIGGLTRVRAIHLDDGHTFCTPEQVKEEVRAIANTIHDFYTALNLWGNHWVSLSIRDSKGKSAYIGDEEDWMLAETMLQEISDEMSLNAKTCEGEAAIYGPKLDFVFVDSAGREWQLATIQIDFALPKRFKLFYTDEHGSKKTPIMIHRAILGSYERFLALLLEHLHGWLPAWLAPTQVAIISVGEKFAEHANVFGSEMREKDIRVEVFDADETLGKKIQKAKQSKIPYIIVIGEKEVGSKRFTLQNNKTGDGAADGDRQGVIQKLLEIINQRVV